MNRFLVNVEEVRSGTAFQRLLKLSNQYIFLRKKSKNIFSVSDFLKNVKYCKKKKIETYI